MHSSQSSETLSYRKLISFFAPLALQTVTQGSTHAIVAMVASHGPGGVLNYAGLAQAYKVMFFLGSVGAGLLTAGMVFGKTRQGYALFSAISLKIALIIACLHLILCIPAVSHQLFGVLIGLPLAIERIARKTFVLIVPLQLLFLLRIPYFAVLFSNRATGRSYLATLGRVALTIVFSVLCVYAGLTGTAWAVVCMTLPVIIELWFLRRFAAPFSADLPPHEGLLPKWTDVVSFALMFSVGKIMISMSNWILAAFISRAPSPERMLPVFAIATSVAGPIGFAASRVQALYVTFADTKRTDPKLRRFVIMTGLVLGAIPLIFIVPPVSTWYYHLMQNVSLRDIGLVRITAIALFPFPLLVAFRAYVEGIAASRKKPFAALTGESFYVVSTVAVSGIALISGAPGNLIGPAGIWAGNAAAGAMILYSLRFEKMIRGTMARAAFWIRTQQ